MSQLRKKFSFQLLHAFSQLLFPLVTYPYLTRTIGPKGLGLVGYVDYVSGLVITLCAFGIPFYGVREVARLQQNDGGRRLVFRQLLTIHFFCSLAGVCVFLLLARINPAQAIPLPLLLAGCAAILLPPFVAEWYMQGMEAFRFTALRSIALRLLGLGALFLFVSSPADFTLYFIITVAVQAAVALTNLAKIGWQNIGFTTSGAKAHLKPLWHFFLTTSVISVYVFFDVIILGWFATEQSVGYYAIAIRIVKLPLLAVLSLNVILFPRISHLFSANDVESIKALIQKAIQFLLLVTLPLAAGIYVLAPQIIGLLAGDAFAPAVPVLRILCGLPLLLGFSNLFVYQVLLPFGKEKLFLMAVLITCVGSLTAHVFLARSFAEKGSATGTLLTEGCMTALTAFFAFRTFEFSFPYKTAIQTLVALLPLMVLVLYCQQQFHNHFLILALSVLPGMLLYSLIQFFVFKNTFLQAAMAGLRRQQKTSFLNG